MTTTDEIDNRARTEVVKNDDDDAGRNHMLGREARAIAATKRSTKMCTVVVCEARFAFKEGFLCHCRRREEVSVQAGRISFYHK